MNHRPYPLANIPKEVRRIIAREVEERSINCKCRCTKARAIFEIILEWEKMKREKLLIEIMKSDEEERPNEEKE